MKKDSDIEQLYENYKRYQLGDHTALDEVFIECGFSNRIQDLDEDYKLLHSDHVLDSELLEDEILQNREEREHKIKFSFDCLNRMVNKARNNYNSSRGTSIGYTNGKKERDSQYRKYYSGEYDLSDINEVMVEIVIKVFQNKVSESNISIINGLTLLQNIKYHFTKEVNKNNSYFYKNIPEIYIDIDGNEQSYFDKLAKPCWIDSIMEEPVRLPLYEDCLRWLEVNDIHNLFNINSFDIFAIIDTILGCEDVFENIEGGLQFVKLDIFKKKIFKFSKRIIQIRNISSALKLVEQRLLDHLLYSFDYYIGKAPHSTGTYCKESERYLYKKCKNSHIEMFGFEKKLLYKMCDLYLAGSAGLEKTLAIIRRYKDLVFSIFLKKSERKSYDSINLITGDYDVLNEREETILYNICSLIIEYFSGKELEQIREITDKYGLYEKQSKREYKFWETVILDGHLQIRIWSKETSKNPIRLNINSDNIMVFGGLKQYYFLDLKNGFSILL